MNNIKTLNPDTRKYIQALLHMWPLRVDIMQRAITTVSIRPGSHILDAGCGIGLQSVELARAAGQNSKVTALDLSQDFLNYAADHVVPPEAKSIIVVQQGDLNALPFTGDHFDCIWSADCVGYMPNPSGTHLSELYRVLKPGGSVALLFWAAQTLLPGHPMLEARLNATTAGIAPFSTNMPVTSHPLRLAGRLQAAGFTDIDVTPFTWLTRAPLTTEIRNALSSLFSMRWGKAKSEVPPHVWSEYSKFCTPGSPDSILNAPNYVAFFTYIMFTAVKPEVIL